MSRIRKVIEYPYVVALVTLLLGGFFGRSQLILAWDWSLVRFSEAVSWLGDPAEVPRWFMVILAVVFLFTLLYCRRARLPTAQLNPLRFKPSPTVKNDLLRDNARKAKTLEFIVQVENTDLHELGTAAIALYDNDHGASIAELGTKLSDLTKDREGEKEGAGKIRRKNADAVYALLNHYEYMATGVRHNIICEDILRNANFSTVISLVKSTKPFIEQLRRRSHSMTIFEAVEWMATRWEKAGYDGELPPIEG